jgi:flagellar biosynthetic protein FliO
VNHKGKRIAALCVLLIVGGGWAGLASRYTAQAQQGGTVQPPDQQEQAGRLEGGKTGTQEGENLPSARFFNFSPSSPLGGGELFLRMMLAVVIVIVLGAAALYLSRKVLPRMTHAGGREIRIVETACLGPRKAIHLVEVGNQRLLIASTAENVTMLTSVGDAWLDIAKQQVEDAVEL